MGPRADQTKPNITHISRVFTSAIFRFFSQSSSISTLSIHVCSHISWEIKAEGYNIQVEPGGELGREWERAEAYLQVTICFAYFCKNKLPHSFIALGSSSWQLTCFLNQLLIVHFKATIFYIVVIQTTNIGECFCINRTIFRQKCYINKMPNLYLHTYFACLSVCLSVFIQ